MCLPHDALKLTRFHERVEAVVSICDEQFCWLVLETALVAVRHVRSVKQRRRGRSAYGCVPDTA